MSYFVARGGYPLQQNGRWLLLLWSWLLLAGFGLARSLEPDPRGFGTHQRLGFPPCSIRVWTGFPCPSCGMTTCFAHFTRGNMRSAAAVSPPGLLLAVVCVAQIPWCWWSVWRGRLVGIRQPTQFLTWGLALFAVACGVFWLMQIAAQRGFSP